MRSAFWIAILAVASFFLGWETWNAWNAPGAPAPPPSAGLTLPPRPTSADNAARAADLAAQVAVIATKPLFRPDRQPFFENAAAAPQRNYQAELSRLSLVGVVLQGEQRKGLVLGTSGARQERWEVGAGDALAGFTVREVQADGLLLAADGREFLLPLYAGPPKAQAGGSIRTETGAPGAPAHPAAGPPPIPAPAPGAGAPQAVPPPPYGSRSTSPPPGTPAPSYGGTGTPLPPGTPAQPYGGRRMFPLQRPNPTQR